MVPHNVDDVVATHTHRARSHSTVVYVRPVGITVTITPFISRRVAPPRSRPPTAAVTTRRGGGGGVCAAPPPPWWSRSPPPRPYMAPAGTHRRRRHAGGAHLHHHHGPPPLSRPRTPPPSQSRAPCRYTITQWLREVLPGRHWLAFTDSARSRCTYSPRSLPSHPSGASCETFHPSSHYHTTDAWSTTAPSPDPAEQRLLIFTWALNYIGPIQPPPQPRPCPLLPPPLLAHAANIRSLPLALAARGDPPQL